MPVGNEVMGCTCFVISTSNYYMLNSDRKWVQISPFGKSTGSSGGDGDGDDGSDSPPEDVVYEGGTI